MYNQIDADSQEITRVNSEHAEILRLLARRQKASGHPYGPIAGTLGAAAFATWGSILRDAQADPLTVVNRAYLAWLAFAIVLGIAASAATVLWASVRSQRQLAADGDRITEYRFQHQVRQIRDQVLAGIRDREQADRRKRWERWMAGNGTEPHPEPGPDAQASGELIPFDRSRGSHRSSG
ncbi:hypothetical protein ACVCAH_11655 [Micromonospora sp. LZ34]